MGSADEHPTVQRHRWVKPRSIELFGEELGCLNLGILEVRRYSVWLSAAALEEGGSPINPTS